MSISQINGPFTDVMRGSGEYFLSDALLEIPDSGTAVFSAKSNGPEGAPVWVRAWLSTEAGTLAEAASDELKAGDVVRLSVKLPGPTRPEFAYMRIESAPLQTEHVVGLKLA